MFAPGARKDARLLYSISEKQLYRIQNKYETYFRYSCYTKKCKASVKLTNDNLLRRLKNTVKHNHDSAEATYKLLLFKQQIKMNVMQSTDPVKKQFEDLLKRYIIFEAHDYSLIIAPFQTYLHCSGDHQSIGSAANYNRMQRNLMQIRKRK